MTTLSHPVLKPVETLTGVGPRVGALLKKVAGARVIDLALLMPTAVVDRRDITTTRAAKPGGIATLVITVTKIEKPRKRGGATRIHVADDTGPLLISYFNQRGDWLEKIFTVGKQLAISGKVEMYEGKKQIAHPDVIVDPAKVKDIAILEPVYPLTANLSGKILRKAIAMAVPTTRILPEWLDGSVIRKNGWRDFGETLTALHAPRDPADILPNAPVRYRLAYDELLANQLAIAIVRDHTRAKRKTITKGDGNAPALLKKIIAALPYQLTSAQERTLKEITADMQAATRMVRLLQGDVGSGKTIVALLTMAIAVSRGEQAAIMAPTEILAQQHYESLLPIATEAGLRIALHTGSVKGAARKKVLDALAAGDIDIIIGTHAIFQNKVEFKNLGCVVIDEQHRFGVEQRVELSNKGRGVDVLVMTATPIPRSLALTYYGDMEVSKLDEKPPGRVPIKTSKTDLKFLDDVIERVRAKIKTGERVYWVCPLIEESDLIDLAAAEERARLLTDKLGKGIVGLMHSRLSADEKNKVMDDFKSGRRPVLVSTTVIEVGVNVPEATVMIIDHAERFGLAQLHQLRGRVGRSNLPSACLLLYDGPLGETARARLKLMTDTEDGFKIAEEDLRLRGAGEVLGTRQSGTALFRIADLALHQDLLLMARDEAKLILSRDPDLQSDRGQALRLLLRLFSMDHSVQYLKAG
ncbi:MAG: ATP-dependent DNA helicase RecG [Bdellovibrionales bacterium]